MEADPYEKFVRMPVRKVHVPMSIVPRERVRPKPGPDPLKRYRLAASSGWAAPVVSIRSLVGVVSKISGLPASDILGPCRVTHFSKARHIAAWLARRFTGCGTSRIAKGIRRKDHASVIYALARVDLAIEEAPIASPGADTPEAWAAALWEAQWPVLARRDPMKART